MQALIKSTALAEHWLIPFVYRLVMPPAALSIFRHPAALSSAFDSWPEPKPSAGQDSMGMTLLRSRQPLASAGVESSLTIPVGLGS